MEDGSIPDNKITASSTYSNSEVAWGRLHCLKGSWAPNTDTGYQWLQVNFVPEVKLIAHITTQGNGKNYWWVKKYYVMYKKRQEALTEYMENSHTVVSWNTIVNNYSLKWRWMVVDIYRAAKRRGKYPSLSPTLRWIIVLVYTTQAEWLADQNVILCVTSGWKFENLSRGLLGGLLGGQ